jgi:calcium-dependent protein kinase
VSSDAKDVIRKMLTLNPAKRISAKDVLTHPWFKSNASSKPLNKKIFQNLTTFRSKSRFRHAIMTFIVTRMLSREDENDLREAFSALDTDGNGILSKEELLIGYKKANPKCTEEEVKAIVEGLLMKLDINDEGEVRFTDFLVAAADNERLLHEAQIKKVFAVFDNDNNGFIEWDELQEAMGSTGLLADDYKKLIKQYDTNGDGKISIDEFREMLLNLN